MIFPPHLSSLNIFTTEIFLKHSTKGFTYEFFRHCETENCRQKNLILPTSSLIQTSSAPESSDTLKGFPTKFLGTVRQKVFDGKSWYSNPFLSINFFTTENFLKHSTKAFTYENFRHCEKENFRQKILILPTASLIQTSSAPESNDTLRGFHTKFLGTEKPKVFDGKS